MSIAHRTVGTGPHTVFVLHGWFGSADGWGDFPAYLDGEAFTWGFTDNRGYGARGTRRATSRSTRSPTTSSPSPTNSASTPSRSSATRWAAPKCSASWPRHLIE